MQSGKRGIVLEGPALLLQAGDRVGDRDRAVELLQRAIDQRAVRPRAAVRDIEVIAAGLGLEAGRAVGGDAAAEDAVGALELAGLAGLLRQFAVAPLAVDQTPMTYPRCRVVHMPNLIAITPLRHGRAPPPGGSPRCWRDRRLAAALEHRRAGDQRIGAGARRPRRRLSGVTPPSISMSIGRPPTSAATRRTLSSAAGMNFWPPKPGIDRHDQDQIDDVDDVLDRAPPACRDSW